jgi:hypothetical protein|tara:strand:- start:4195 stop:5916 length:1722 start_codon:yes stop_codon:yes gene_type:complete
MARTFSISELEFSLIGFSEDAKKYIEKSTQTSKEQNKIYADDNTLMGSGGGNSDLGFNFWGYSADSGQSFKEQFDIDNVLGQYFYPPLVKAIDLLIKDAENSIDLGGDLEKSKIKYSSIPRGIFDFSKASKGLIRPVEYYSKELDKLVSADDVNKKTIGGIKSFFYQEGEDVFICEPRQEGTTEMLKSFPNTLKKSYLRKLNLYVPETLDGTKVIKKGNKRLRFTSTEKKVYAYRERLGGGIAPYVDLFINNSGYYRTTSAGRFLRAIPSLMIAKLLETAGVNTRIWSGEFSSFNGNAYIQTALIKEYGTPLDLNQTAVLVSDSRYFRGLGSNAKFGFFYNLQNEFVKIDDSIDKLKNLDWGSSRPFNGEDVVAIMPYLRNAYYYYANVGKVKPTQANKNLMLAMSTPFKGDEDWFYFEDFEGNRLPDGKTPTFKVTRGQVKYIYKGKEVKAMFKDFAKEKTIEAFNRNIDYISLMISKNPKGVISRIRNRQIEDFNFSESEADRYLSDILSGDVFKNISFTNNDVDNPNAIQKSLMSTKEEIIEGKKTRKKIITMINDQIKSSEYKFDISNN